MSRIFLTIAVLAAAFTASAEEYGIFWKNTEADGSFSDPKMWMTENGGSEETPHFDKGPERWMRMFTKSGGNHTAILKTRVKLSTGNAFRTKSRCGATLFSIYALGCNRTTRDEKS